MRSSLLCLCLLCLMLNASAQHAFTYLASYDKVPLYGFTDSAGNLRTMGKYNLIFQPSEGTVMVQAGRKTENDYESQRHGYNRVDGTEIAPPIYHQGLSFSNGLAAVGTTLANWQTKWGYIDTKGKLVIAQRYDAAKEFASGLAPVGMGGPEKNYKTWNYIDKTGTIVIKGDYWEADTLSDGLAAVGVEQKRPYGIRSSVIKGYIDTRGNMVIQPQFLSAGPFKNGVAIVLMTLDTSLGGRDHFYAMIDRTGKRISTARKYIHITQYGSDELYSGKVSGSMGLNKETDTWVVIDKTGKELSGIITGTTPIFSDGLCAFRKGDKYGYFDKTGKVVIEPKYASGMAFSEGLVAAKETKEGLYGFINKKGEMVIAPKYISASYFKEGLVSVGSGKSEYGGDVLFGVIDKTGKTVIPFEYRTIDRFVNGRAVAQQGNIQFYLYKNGKTTLASDPATIMETRYAIEMMGKGNYAGALEKLQKIESKNYPPANFYQGLILYQAKPPQQDMVKGTELINKAATAGYTEALYTAALVNMRSATPDYTRVLQWLTKAEAGGVPEATREIGAIYEKGLGMPANPAKAATYYEKSVELGDPVAMYQLAQMYKEARGVAKNEARASYLINESARRGYAPAKQLQTKQNVK